MELVLASQSPRRAQLLKLLFREFCIDPADCEEIVPDGIRIEKNAEYLAILKATVAAKQHPCDLVIGSDTIVVCDGQLLGKPKDRVDAHRMLRLLSGHEHSIYTGVCLCLGEVRHAFTAEAKVCFYPLTDSEIEAYLATSEPYDKAGAYGIQGLASLFVKRMIGDMPTVMGLPLARLRRELLAFGKEHSALAPLLATMTLGNQFFPEK